MLPPLGWGVFLPFCCSKIPSHTGTHLHAFKSLHKQNTLTHKQQHTPPIGEKRTETVSSIARPFDSKNERNDAFCGGAEESGMLGISSQKSKVSNNNFMQHMFREEYGFLAWSCCVLGAVHAAAAAAANGNTFLKMGNVF